MTYGKGAVQTPEIVRKQQFHIMKVSKPVDWSKPFTVEKDFKLRQRNQGSSSSCTAQATGYYTEALEKIEQSKDEKYSNRFIYSQTYLPGGGTYIWKAMKVPLIGLASQDSVPDGDSSELIMQDTSLNGSAIIEAKADKYAVIPRSNIDEMAGIIEDYHGFVTGFNGNNSMFLPDGTTQVITTADWGHAVYVCGYELRNGKKCLKFKNSWSENWGDGGYGYFPEEFVNSGWMFDCYVYADIQDIENTMTETEVKKLYVLAFYREPTVDELNFWTGKGLLEFLTTAITDRSKFLAQHE
jgi:hypothetical protein